MRISFYLTGGTALHCVTMFTMASAREARPRYDEQYKQLFAFPRMVEDLLRAFVAIYSAPATFSTLRKLSSDYISDALLTRRGDTVWRLRTGPLPQGARRAPER